MRKFLSAAIAALVISAGAGWSAPAKAAEQSEERKLLYRYAGCLLESDTRNIRRFLVGDPNDPAMNKWRKGFGGDCLMPKHADSNRLAYINPDGATLRLVLADVMMTRKLPAMAANLSVVPPLLQPAMPPASAKGGAVEIQKWFAWVSDLGECAVRANPEAAAAVLRTTPESKEELAAMQAAVGSAGECVKGGVLEIDPISLRGTIALNYLRLADAAASKEAAE